MENFNIGIMVICGALILWEVMSIFFTMQKVKVEGKVPGQKVGICLFAVACGIIVLVKGNMDKAQIISIASIVVAAMLNFFIKNGLSDYGLYINGWSTPYKDMKYFDMERREGELYRTRFSSLRKEQTLLFTEEQYNQALILLGQHDVYDMETYTALKRKQKEEMERNGAATRKKRKK